VRIASLVPSATEMLFALGLGDEVVGVTHECDYPPTASALPHLTRTVLPSGLGAAEIDAAVKAAIGDGGALYSLDEERLADLRPDLIVTQAVCEVCAVSYDDVVSVAARLPGTPRVVQQDPTTLGDVLDDVTALGVAADREERAFRLRRSLEARLEATETAVAGAARPRVLALEWLDPPFVAGHWVPEMIHIAGGEDVLGAAGCRSEEIGWDRLAAAGSEIVVVMPCGWRLEDSRAEALAHRDQIRRLGADRVYAVDAAASFSRPGPRLVEGTELLAQLLHPERVAAAALPASPVAL
jgi:iron complex transport system substrate-binding protein